MKKNTKLGLLGLALAGGAAGGLAALYNRIYTLAMAPRPHNPRFDDVLPRSQREGIAWARRGEGFQRLTLRSTDGLTLSAALIRAQEESHRWVICLHGYSESHIAMGAHALHYHQAGWNVLMPDQRAHGESQGDHVGWGYEERLDLVGWISLLVRRDPQAEIVLHGVSLGGATVLMTTGGPLPKQVKCAVSDCSFTSFEHQVQHILARHRDSLAQGIQLPTGLAFNLLRRTALRRAGFDLRDASPLKAVERSTTPTLFIHGTQDDFVPAHMMEKLYQAAACPKARLWVPEGEHATSVGTDPELYWSTVDAFLSEHLA